jgi:16S rRNA (guanine527-N7)-methyltransferase
LKNLLEQQVWNDFQDHEGLSSNQLEQFKQYYHALIEWNERFNLTAITELKDIIEYHFKDSLQLAHSYDMTKVKSITDIGCGAGFPVIPLKIKYPHLAITLLEVNQKKITFLQHVATILALTDVTYDTSDWRAFLRTHKKPIDLFVSRAALSPEELVRIFNNKQSIYYTSTLVYWASEKWSVQGKEERYVDHIVSYRVGDRNRKLVFFRAH